MEQKTFQSNPRSSHGLPRLRPLPWHSALLDARFEQQAQMVQDYYFAREFNDPAAVVRETIIRKSIPASARPVTA